jgi:RNA polymerase sigma-70 factor (ECF subfamily)
MVESVRPDLHRYCARLTGSVIDGEDIVGHAREGALRAKSGGAGARPWLFRTLQPRDGSVEEPRPADRGATIWRRAGFDERPDPSVVRAALARFLALPLSQRSAVILKDVLDHSLEETAEIMGTTVMAVKAALVRGRAKLAESEPDREVPDAASLAVLNRYAALFNARDWDGVRTLVADDCKLDLVSKSQRRGKAVGMYFGRYEKEDVSLRPVRLEGRLALAAYVARASEPAYFILLDCHGGRVQAIRDFRYVPYITADASFEPV